MASTEWTEDDYRNLRDWMMLGVYETAFATIGKPVYTRKVFEHIEMKGYWGRPDLLAKYFKFRDNDDTYKKNVNWVIQRLVGEEFLVSRIGFEHVSLSRIGRDFVTKRFGSS